jgi:hypothetical protein
MITLEKGKKYPNYYACNAALNIGLIYEEKNNKAQARKYYNLCLSLSPSNTNQALHQRLKQDSIGFSFLLFDHHHKEFRTSSWRNTVVTRTHDPDVK